MKHDSNPPQVPACSLDAPSLQRQVAWIDRLNTRFLRKSEHSDLALTLEYAPEALDEVSELLRRETQCCEFLTFDLRHDERAVILRVDVPAHLSARADELLAPFSGQLPQEQAGCCGSCETAAPPEVASNKLAGTAAGSAATAVAACAACCVLPLAFPAIAAGAAGGLLAWLGGAHLWLTVLSILLVLGAWAWIWRQASKRKARTAPMTIGLMTIASLATVLALVWPALEGSLIRVLP